MICFHPRACIQIAALAVTSLGSIMLRLRDRVRVREDGQGHGYRVERMDYPPRGRLSKTGNLLYSLKQ